MYKKKVILFGSILGVIFVLILSLYFVFCVKEVNVNFYYSTVNLTEDSVISKLESKNILPYGSNIFFVNTTDLTNKIEETEPRIKIKNIEMVFPNKIKINCEERADAFYTVINGKAVILDSELKILDEETVSSVENKTLINIQDSFLQSDTIEKGKSLEIMYGNECASVFTCLITYYQNKIDQTSFCKHFMQIDVLQGYDENKQKVLKLVFYVVSGKKIEIENPTENMNSKLGALIEFISDNENITQDKIVIVG
jgi:hypothetical protein